MSTVSNPAKKVLRNEIKKILATMTAEDRANQSASIASQVREKHFNIFTYVMRFKLTDIIDGCIQAI